MGATPGLIAGSCLGMKWVFPFLGAAGAALVGLLLVVTHTVENGPLFAGLVLLGLIVGSWPYLAAWRRSSKQSMDS